MKTFFTFSVFFITFWANATTRTVSNSPANIAQFNTIQGAIDASANTGDIVYVHGTPITYVAFTISNKQITIIGPGWAPDKNLPFTANVAGCTITGAASSGTEIQGITFTGAVNMNGSHPDNIRFIRNNFAGIDLNMNQSSTTYIGFLFEGNVFDNAIANANNSSQYNNFLFQNNYFYESGCCRDGNLGGSWFNCTNVLFDHNIWFGPSSANRNVTDGNANRFLTFTNNIFVRRNFNNRVTGCIFNNNISFNCGIDNQWDTNGNVNSGGNIAGTDPQTITNLSAGVNSATADYTITAGPANNGGSDGKDIGLLYDTAGSLNWTNSRNSRLPRIFSLNITTPTVAAGQDLSVTVDARKSN